MSDRDQNTHTHKTASNDQGIQKAREQVGQQAINQSIKQAKQSKRTKTPKQPADLRVQPRRHTCPLKDLFHLAADASTQHLVQLCRRDVHDATHLRQRLLPRADTPARSNSLTDDTGRMYRRNRHHAKQRYTTSPREQGCGITRQCSRWACARTSQTALTLPNVTAKGDSMGGLPPAGAMAIVT